MVKNSMENKVFISRVKTLLVSAFLLVLVFILTSKKDYKLFETHIVDFPNRIFDVDFYRADV